jgi:PmbA protein
MAINAVVSSTGISRAAKSTIAWVMATAIATDGTDSFEGYGLSVSRRFDGLDDAAAVADAVDRATRMIGASKPPSSNNTAIVMDKRITASLLSIIGSTLDGESVAKGRSLFGDSLGKSIAPDFVNLVEDPTNAAAFGASSYDGEGLATRRVQLIEDGVLMQYLHDSYSARRLGATPTASAQRGGFAGAPHPGARALFLTPGSASQAQLCEQAGDGVLILTITGLHSGVNAVSGDFSVGAEGIVIKNGQLGGPVREFTIGSTLQSLLSSIRAVGNDVEYMPSAAAGVSTLIDGVTISGA